jgi:hypothetical protein
MRTDTALETSVMLVKPPPQSGMTPQKIFPGVTVADVAS